MPLERQWNEIIEPVAGVPRVLETYPLKWIEFEGIARKKNRELSLGEARQWVARGRALIVQEWEHAGLVPAELAAQFIDDHVDSILGDDGDAKIFVYGRKEGEMDARIVSIIFGY